MQPSRQFQWIVFAVGLGLLLRLSAIVFMGHTPASDELAYRSMALSLVTHGQIIDFAGNKAMYNVGYPLLVLAPIYWLVGQVDIFVRIANAVLGASSVALIYLVAKESGIGNLGRLFAAFAWAIYLPSIAYSVYLFKENLMIPLMLALLLLSLRSLRAPSWTNSLLIGLLVGLLALTGNAALSLLTCTIYCLFASKLGARTWLHLCAMAFAATLVVSPWLYRNSVELGSPVLNTNGGFNLYLGNNPAADGFFVSIADTPMGSSWEELRKTGEIEASNALKAEAYRWIIDNPSEFARLALKKFGNFWMPPVHSGKGSQSRLEQVVRLGWLAQYLVIGALAAYGALRIGLVTQPATVLWIGVLSYSASHMLFYVIVRYREPIMPLAILLAAFAIDLLTRRWSRSRRLVAFK